MTKDTPIKTKINKKPHCVIELEVKTDSSIVKKARKEALKDLKKEVTIPGFRKGKAPDDAVLKKYPEAVKDKWEKKLADLSFIEAHKTDKLPPLGSSSRIVFNLKDYSIEKGSEIIFTYETEPEIPKIDPKAYKPKEIKKTKVTKKEINEAIRQSRFFFAKWKSVNREIKENDYIILDLESLDIDPPTKVFADTRFEVSDKSMAQWMKDIVLGAKVGDVLEGISKPDKDAPEKEKKAFEQKKVRVTIKKIEEAELPDLNDEFAAKLGSKNIEEMEKNIKSMLEKQAEEKEEKEKREAVNSFFLTVKFELPSTLVKTELESRKQSLLKDPNFKSKYDKMTKEEKNDTEKDIQKHAEEAIKLFYITRKIIKDFNIQIPDEEIKQEALNILFMQSGKTQVPDSKNIPKDTYALALSRLVLKKAQDYILENCSKN